MHSIKKIYYMDIKYSEFRFPTFLTKSIYEKSFLKTLKIIILLILLKFN